MPDQDSRTHHETKTRLSEEIFTSSKSGTQSRDPGIGIFQSRNPGIGKEFRDCNNPNPKLVLSSYMRNAHCGKIQGRMSERWSKHWQQRRMAYRHILSFRLRVRNLYGGLKYGAETNHLFIDSFIHSFIHLD